MRQLFLLTLHLVDLLENRKALGEDRAAGKREAVLRQVAALDSTLLREGAVVERVDAGKDFEQRGLAGAVGAYQADAIMRRDQPVKFLEEDLGAKALAGCGELNH